MARLRLTLAFLRAMIVVSTRRVFRGALHPGWRWRKEVLGHALRAQARRTGELPIDVQRKRFPTSVLPRRLAKQVFLEQTVANGVPAERVTPLGWRPDAPTVLYMHGGGYALCSPATHRELVARIALAAGARCLSIEYRLAPEHPCPAAVDDAVSAYRSLLEAGTRPGSIVFGGDSAGGGLALATLLRLRTTGDPLPGAAVLLSPWVDMSCSGESIDTNARYCYLQRSAIERFAKQYLQEREPFDPMASPVHADLSGLPPLLVQAGSAEALYSECVLLAERARTAGVDVTLQVGEGMVHVWQALARILPEARRSIDDIGEFVRTRTAVTPRVARPAASVETVARPVAAQVGR